MKRNKAMEASVGLARLYKGKLYFNDAGWEILQSVARHLHRSPKQVAIATLKRHLKTLDTTAKRKKR